MDEIRPRQHALNILLIESGADTPRDPADFGRCYRLLELVPEWRADLQKVADKHPKWGPLVAVWDELTELYEEEIKNEDGRAPKLYARMQELYDDCMIAAGFEKTSEYSWSRKK